MSDLLKVAFRNVGRNKRRTLITIITVFLGVVVATATRGLLNGLQDEIRSNLTRKMHGDLQIHKVGYQDSLETNPYKMLIPAASLGPDAAPRLKVMGLLNHQKSQTTTPVVLTGIDSQRELVVCPRFAGAVQQGVMLDSSRERMASAVVDEELGEAAGLDGPAPPPPAAKAVGQHQMLVTPSLMRGMGAALGDEVVVLMQDKDNMQQALVAQIAGVVDLGMPGTAARMAWMDLKSLQTTLAVDGLASEIALRLPDGGESVDAAKARLQATLPPDQVVETWLEVGGFFRDAMAVQDVVFSAVVAIVFAIVIAAIVNTSLMTVMERTREIGTLMALGYRRRHILTLFLGEAAVIGAAGGLLGLAVGSGVVATLHVQGLAFRLPGVAEATRIFPAVGAQFLLLVLGLAVAAALISGLVPAYRASRMRPVQALSSLLVLFALWPVAARGQSATDIVRKVEQALAPGNVKATYAFTNTRSDGTTTSYEIRFAMRDASRSHGVFQNPEREKGREVLRLGDDLWTFVPNVGRVVRIADRDSFAGGDFSNADVLRVDWLDKYDAKLLKDLPSQWIVELDAKRTDAAYARMRLWVDKKTGQPVQQQYYDSRGTLLKRCLYGDVKSFGGAIERPARLVMENVITKQKSELVVQEMAKVDALPDSRFVVDNLGK
jgi:putative ABC transport system permease protein